MEETYKSKDKIKKMCDVLRHETIEPAVKEAKFIVEKAKDEAKRILSDAKSRSEELIENAQKEIKKKQDIFQITLNQAYKQTLNLLKQELEDKLFNKNIVELLSNEMKNPKLLSDIITTILKCLEKDGILYEKIK